MSPPSKSRQLRNRIKAVLFEAVMVAMIGCALAFAANALSPRGLKIAHNYFPAGTNMASSAQNPLKAGHDPGERHLSPSLSSGLSGGEDARRAREEVSLSTIPTQTTGNVQVAGNGSKTNSSPAPKLISVPRLIDAGLQGIDYDQAVQFFKDPRRQQGLVAFVDARNDTQYQKGHIPGAYLLDPYHSNQYLATVLPVCQKAEQVVVYCVASECEDSQLAAVLLRKAGVANDKLFVYVSGFTEWTANHQPVETGARNSGDLYTPRE